MTGLIFTSEKQENGSFHVEIEPSGEFTEADAGSHVLFLAEMFAKTFKVPIWSVLRWAAEMKEATIRKEYST